LLFGEHMRASDEGQEEPHSPCFLPEPPTYQSRTFGEGQEEPHSPCFLPALGTPTYQSHLLDEGQEEPRSSYFLPSPTYPSHFIDEGQEGQCSQCLFSRYSAFLTSYGCSSGGHFDTLAGPSSELSNLQRVDAMVQNGPTQKVVLL